MHPKPRAQKFPQHFRETLRRRVEHCVSGAPWAVEWPCGACGERTGVGKRVGFHVDLWVERLKTAFEETEDGR